MAHLCWRLRIGDGESEMLSSEGALLSHRFGSVTAAGREPGIALGVEAGVVGIEVDEAALDQEVANLEDVAPAARVCDAGAPLSVAVDTGACSFTGERVGTGHDPVERGVIVQDALDKSTKIGEQLTDLFLAGCQAPFWKENLCIVGKQVEDTLPRRCDSLVVECLQVFQRDRFSLLVGHRLSGYRHGSPPAFLIFVVI